MHAQLENHCLEVRRTVVEALSTIGTAASIDKLLARRNHEESVRAVAGIDEAVEKFCEVVPARVEGRPAGPGGRESNQRLEERLKKLEKPQLVGEGVRC